MKNILKSWKTSLLGSVAGGQQVMQVFADGVVTGDEIGTLVTGVCLILIGLFAKDADVTHTK